MLFIVFIFGILFVFCVILIAVVYDYSRTEIEQLSTDLHEARTYIAELKDRVDNNSPLITKNIERLRDLRHAVVMRLNKIESNNGNKKGK